MESLFPYQPPYPPGFVYVPDFLNSAEELYLCEQVSKIQLHTFIFQGFEAKRKVASFGYDYSFDQRVLTRGNEIPESFHPLIDKVSKHLSIPKEDFSELLVTEYPVGSVINWHRDAPPFDLIVGISLLSDCAFRLRPHDKTKQGRKAIISFPVKKRSLYLMKGLARSEWEHSISPVKAVRYSITLRTLIDSRK
jgi:alkylated DNA repair dioxygenase AlkB